jgi:hypothetical protein
MNKTKYVIVNGSAIVFSAAITHSDMVGYGEKCDGAGFVRFVTEKDEYDEYVVKARCYGRSVSLDIDSREIDSRIVTSQICDGY